MWRYLVTCTSKWTIFYTNVLIWHGQLREPETLLCWFYEHIGGGPSLQARPLLSLTLFQDSLPSLCLICFMLRMRGLGLGFVFGLVFFPSFPFFGIVYALDIGLCIPSFPFWIGPQWTSTHQCTIHWMPVTTRFWMNLTRVNIWFHLGNQFYRKRVSYIGRIDKKIDNY